MEGEEVEAETYVWKDMRGFHLEERPWDFSEFQREKLHNWVDSEDEFEGRASYRGAPDLPQV